MTPTLTDSTDSFQWLEQLVEKACPAGGGVPEAGKIIENISKPWKPSSAPDVLLSEIQAAGKSDYIAAVQGLSPTARAAAASWLQRIVDA